jgi:hypothetical protein
MVRDHACKDLTGCWIGIARVHTHRHKRATIDSSAQTSQPQRTELSTAVVKVTADLSALYYINVCSPALGMYGWVDATIPSFGCV